MAGLVLSTGICALAGCQASYSASSDGETMQRQASVTSNLVVDDPAQVGPIKVGSNVPSAAVKNMEGQMVDLGESLSQQNTVLVFFRGGWCPFCTKHLAEVQGVLPQIKQAGYQVLAIAPDTVANLKQAGEKHDLGYQLLADEQFEATKAFGLGFYLDQGTITRYKGYGIPLYSPPGDEGKVLPVPAVFVIKDGMVTFRHYDPDYKSRLSSDEILKAVGAK
jgi:peroxiredoxin